MGFLRNMEKSRRSEGGVEWLERGKIYEGQENLHSNRISSDPSWELQHKLDQENEIVKVWLKREKNRLAATKCREKKKEKLNTLLGKAEQLERFNNDLRQECYRLEAEKTYLVKMLMDKAAEDVKYSCVDDENMQRAENLPSAYG